MAVAEGGPAAQGTVGVGREALRECFDKVDKDASGELSKREIVLALRKSPELANLLGLPQRIRAGDGSEDALQALMSSLDTDGNASISFEEFCGIIDGVRESGVGEEAPAAIALEGPAAAADPAPLTRPQVSSGLRQLVKRADGLGAAYLAVELPGAALSDLEALRGYPHLQTVRAPHNAVADLAPLGALPHLTELDASHNRLETVLAIEPAPQNLRVADLSHNLLREVPPLPAYTKLTSLALSGNRITSVGGLAGLSSLKTLRLDGNVLKSLEGLAPGLSASLQELSVSGNRLSSLESLAGLTALKTLHAARNQLTGLRGIEDMADLTELDVAGNDVPDHFALKPAESLGLLQRLNLEGNPADAPEGRLNCLYVLPGLTLLSGVEVTAKERVLGRIVNGEHD